MSREWKLFPLRLPKEYHGKPRPFRKLSEINRERSNERDNPEYIQSKIGHWQLKRLDRDVMSERTEFIVHPAKVSEDAPGWFKTTHHYFYRGNYAMRNQGKVDVNNSTFLGRTQAENFRPTNSFSESRRIRPQPPVTEKVGGRDPSLSGGRWFSQNQQVSAKVGSLQNRNFAIRRPQLKIGVHHADNFVNTYSVV